MTEWWTNQDAGLIGGLGGSAVGLMGAAIGIIAGVFARQGKHKPAAIGLLVVLITACMLSLVTGIVAAVLKQPYHVWYPLVLLGCIGAIVGGSMIPVLLNVYRQAEHRRFEAEQIRRA